MLTAWPREASVTGSRPSDFQPKSYNFQFNYQQRAPDLTAKRVPCELNSITYLLLPRYPLVIRSILCLNQGGSHLRLQSWNLPLEALNYQIEFLHLQLLEQMQFKVIYIKHQYAARRPRASLREHNWCLILISIDLPMKSYNRYYWTIAHQGIQRSMKAQKHNNADRLKEA